MDPKRVRDFASDAINDRVVEQSDYAPALAFAMGIPA